MNKNAEPTTYLVGRGHFRKYVLNRIHRSRVGTRARGPKRTMSPRDPRIQQQRKSERPIVTTLARIFGMARGR